METYFEQSANRWEETIPVIVKLLPALPKQFPSGYVKGIRIKGRQAVDVAWENGKITTSEIYTLD